MKNVSNKTFIIAFLSLFFFGFFAIHSIQYYIDSTNKKDLKEFVENINNEDYCKHYFLIENKNTRNLCRNKRKFSEGTFLLRMMTNQKHEPELNKITEKFVELAISKNPTNHKELQPVHVMNRFKQINQMYREIYTKNIDNFEFKDTKNIDKIYQKIDQIGASIVQEINNNYKSIEQNGFKYG